MNVVSSPRFIARHLAGADHTGAAAQPGAALLRLRSAQNDSSTRVTTGQSDDRRVVYDDWRSGGTASRAGHLWSSPIGRDDTVSALMARNRGLNSYQMSDQWRGLGGALLTQFGKTGAGFSQTMADDSNARLPDVVDSLQVLSPAEQAQRSVEILAMQQTDLAGVTQGAQTAALKIQTRSGQSVELKIAVNSGERGTVGMKVELEASAELSADERSTVAQLANGLDRALEGLGRDDALALDLAGLMGYDRGLISSIDLTASNPSTHQPLHTFALHLGDHEQTIALKGSDGELNVTVVAPPATGSATRKQQPSAMQQMLHRMDAAAQRGHAADALVQQMKSAFTAFQTAFAAAQGKDEDPDKLLTVSPLRWTRRLLPLGQQWPALRSVRRLPTPRVGWRTSTSASQARPTAATVPGRTTKLGGRSTNSARRQPTRTTAAAASP